MLYRSKYRVWSRKNRRVFNYLDSGRFYERRHRTCCARSARTVAIPARNSTRPFTFSGFRVSRPAEFAILVRVSQLRLVWNDLCSLKGCPPRDEAVATIPRSFSPVTFAERRVSSVGARCFALFALPDFVGPREPGFVRSKRVSVFSATRIVAGIPRFPGST